MILITHSTIVVQALFHHMCLQLTVDFGTHISSIREYALAFVEQGVFLFAYVRFSRNDELCRVIRRTGPTLGQAHAEHCFVSCVMVVSANKPTLVRCVGSFAETLRLFDGYPFQRPGIPTLPRFDKVSISCLMHKKSFSVCGRIESSPYCSTY